jgi:hypothetical protein
VVVISATETADALTFLTNTAPTCAESSVLLALDLHWFLASPTSKLDTFVDSFPTELAIPILPCKSALRWMFKIIIYSPGKYLAATWFYLILVK